MPRVSQAGEFFVVGGPVQPDRACYVERRADEALIRSITDEQFSYVLSPRALGKSSLMARTIRKLRRERQLAAVIDLTQIGARGDGEDAGRWYYSIAYRVLRELRLKVDLQSWWQDKSVLLSEQRLVEFFWEIVLTNTAEPVTIFFDEIERARDLPFARELFAALRTCYARRVSEPDFSRLNFVVLGVSTPAQLCPDESLSPFVDGRAIELTDFTAAECHQLAAGFDLDDESGRALMDRIYRWTHGQPYLTQKVARGVARKGGRLADVERVVHEQFLAPGASQEEPLLNHIRTLLTVPAPGARQALSLLAKLGRGGEVVSGGAAPRELLGLAGIVRRDASGRMRFRNQIYEQVFDSKWAAQASPINWRRPVTVAAAVVVVVLLPFWYLQILPRPYVDILSVVTEDYAVAEDAYEKLHRIPGFASRADRLLSGAMSRRSEAARTITEVLAADAVLRSLPDRGALADELMGQYWLRRSRAAASSEQRDVALLLAMQALPGQREAVRGIAAELIGSDYPRLTRSFRLPEPPLDWRVDWERDELVVIDQAHRVQHLALHERPQASSADDVGRVERIPGRLTALQHVPVTRELNVDEGGVAGAFNLLLTLRHAKASDLLVTVTAPSGAQATLAVPQPRADQQALRFSARSGSPLVTLADEERQGLWRLTVVDQRSDEVGVLLSWGLQFAADVTIYMDEPEQGVALPDPVRTDEVEIELDDAGRVALARPTRLGTVGALAVWDLIRGQLIRDLQTQSPVEHVVYSSERGRAIVATADTLTIWELASDAPTATLETRTAFVLPPALSPEGGYVAVAEQVDFFSPLFSLLSVDDGELLASVEGTSGTTDWVLGPQARYLALLGAGGRVRLIDPRTGRQLAELRHQREVERLIAVPEQDLLVTADSAGDLYAWRVQQDAAGAVAQETTHLGSTIDVASVSVADDASMVAFEVSPGRVEVRDLDGERNPGHFRLDPGVITQVSPDARELLTANGGTLFRLWQLDEGEPGPSPDLNLSALVLDREGRTVALGYRGGHVQVRDVGELRQPGARPDSVDFIGHRGAVASLALNASRNIAASGGADGVVRVWDLTSVAPSPHFMRHPAGPIRAIDISADGRWIVSAAQYSARVWAAQDGELVGEIPVNGAALSVACARQADLVVVGDSAGNVFFGAPRGSEPLLSARAQAAVQAVAVSPDASLIATGDSDGNFQLWDAATAAPVGEHVFTNSVSWLKFSPDGGFALVRSGHWLHRLQLTGDGVSIVDTRLLPVGLEADAVSSGAQGESLRLVGGRETGRAAFRDLDLTRPTEEPLPADSPLFARDWESILGLTVDRRTGIVRNSP